jgi:integrase
MESYVSPESDPNGDPSGHSPEERAALLERLQGYKILARSENTRLAYERDWKHFTLWCERRGFAALPAEPVAVDLYLTEQADLLKPSTLARRLVAISRVHQAAGYDPPTKAAAVRETFQGIRRVQGTARRKMQPLLVEHLRQIVSLLPDTLLGKRDKALLLVGFAGGFRASELSALQLGDVQFVPQGMVITLRRSKTDQAGEGQAVGIRYGQGDTCPVEALRAWTRAAGIKSGPLLRPLDRHGNVQPEPLTRFGILYVVKRSAESIGLDPALYAGHSLRAGLATSAALAGASERVIMKTTRHKSEKMVREYIRVAELFEENAAAMAGL